jgi:hypothetical protein
VEPKRDIREEKNAYKNEYSVKSGQKNAKIEGFHFSGKIIEK